MTPNDEVNTLAAMEFAERFGRVEVYQLAMTTASSQRRDRVAAYIRGRTLFRKDATYDLLAGAGPVVPKSRRHCSPRTLRSTTSARRYGMSAMLLFVLDESGNLIVNTGEGPKALKAGQKVIALVDPAEPPSEVAKT